MLQMPNPAILRQSAAIPYRFAAGMLQVAVITNKTGERWLVPKGHIEPELTAQQSAAKEAFEEAGLHGVMHREAIGRFEYRKRRIDRIVDVFPMAVTRCLREWPEMTSRRRCWLPVEHAVIRIEHPQLADCVRALPGLLSRSVAA
ncbi:MAG: NUDIX hydrolase [Planctomycetota bacterium]